MTQHLTRIKRDLLDTLPRPKQTLPGRSARADLVAMAGRAAPG